METLENVVELLKRQEPNQWAKPQVEKDRYFHSKNDFVSTEFTTSVESIDYSITRTRKLKQRYVYYKHPTFKWKDVLKFTHPDIGEIVPITDENAEWAVPLWESEHGEKIPEEVFSMSSHQFPDHQTTTYLLTAHSEVSKDGTTISEHLEYRNDRLLENLFNHIDEITKLLYPNKPNY